MKKTIWLGLADSFMYVVDVIFENYCDFFMVLEVQCCVLFWVHLKQGFCGLVYMHAING